MKAPQVLGICEHNDLPHAEWTDCPNWHSLKFVENGKKLCLVKEYGKPIYALVEDSVLPTTSGVSESSKPTDSF